AVGLKLQDGEDDENAQAPLHELARQTGLLLPNGNLEAALLDATLSPSQAGGLPANLRALQNVAFNLRERMSQDNWRILNSVLHDLPDHPLPDRKSVV